MLGHLSGRVSFLSLDRERGDHLGECEGHGIGGPAGRSNALGVFSLVFLVLFLVGR